MSITWGRGVVVTFAQNNRRVRVPTMDYIEGTVLATIVGASHNSYVILFDDSRQLTLESYYVEFVGDQPAR